jgi:hypothetical protein
MNYREYKRAARANAIRDLEKVAWYLDRIWDRKCPPVSKDAPVATVPTPEEFHRELMAMHVDDRELLLASSGLHEIIDDLRLVLPSRKIGGAS